MVWDRSSFSMTSPTSRFGKTYFLVPCRKKRKGGMSLSFSRTLSWETIVPVSSQTERRRIYLLWKIWVWSKEPRSVFRQNGGPCMGGLILARIHEPVFKGFRPL